MSPQRCTLGCNAKGFIPRVNEVILRSKESEHPDQSQVAQAFPRLSLSDLRVFVFAKQAATAGVAESNSGVCNMYDKRERYQHQRVRGGLPCLTSYALSPIGPHSNATDNRSRQRGAARAVDEQIGCACVCRAHACVPCVHLAL